MLYGTRRAGLRAPSAYMRSASSSGSRRGWESASELPVFLEQLGIEIVPFDELQISAALEAYSRYGKGVHSKARLNLGDCVAYALAKSMKVPLLFKGADFTETDV